MRLRPFLILLGLCASVAAWGAAPLKVAATRPEVAWIAGALGGTSVAVVEDPAAAALVLAYSEKDPVPEGVPQVIYLSDGLPRTDAALGFEAVSLDPRWLGYLLVGISEVLAEQLPEGAEALFERAGALSKELRLGSYQIRRGLRELEQPVAVALDTSPQVLSILESLRLEFERTDAGREIRLPAPETWENLLSPYAAVAEALKE